MVRPIRAYIHFGEYVCFQIQTVLGTTDDEAWIVRRSGRLLASLGVHDVTLTSRGLSHVTCHTVMRISTADSAQARHTTSAAWTDTSSSHGLVRGGPRPSITILTSPIRCRLARLLAASHCRSSAASNFARKKAVAGAASDPAD
jgi:hypothetical protein